MICDGTTRSDRLRRRLLRAIGRRFATTTTVQTIGTLRFEFTQIADPDAVLDLVCDEETRRQQLPPDQRPAEPLRIPYWAAVWESALAIGQYLARHWPLAGQQPEVLDLGCGMGLAGMAAAALGGNVLLADNEPHALLLARLNTLRWLDRCRVRRVDWKLPHPNQQFDLILGADILYERPQWDAIERYLRTHVHPDGVVLLGEPGRPTAAEFPRWAHQRDWASTTTLEPVELRLTPVNLHRLQRASI